MYHYPIPENTLYLVVQKGDSFLTCTFFEGTFKISTELTFKVTKLVSRLQLMIADKNSELSWEMRIRIAIDAAQGKHIEFLSAKPTH